MKPLSFFLFLSVFLCSCGPSGQRQSAVQLQEVVGKELYLPQESADTADRQAITVAVYYNAEGCSPCKLKELYQWRTLIEDAYTTDGIDSTTLRFAFVLHQTEENPLLRSEPAILLFDHPVNYDTTGVFEVRNTDLLFPNPQFHTFLLNRQNEVVLVGSPVGNPKMWELYKQTIQKLIQNEGTMEPDV